MSYKSSRYNKVTPCVFVGNLPGNVIEEEVYELFGKFGRVKYVDIKKGKISNTTSFAFVHYYNIKDAEYAIRKRDGYNFDGFRLRVEFSGENRSFAKYRKKEDMVGPLLRTEHRLIVSNLPENCKWQQLKDIMRQCGDVGYANIENGKGIVEFIKYDDMLHAIDKFDGAEFKVFDQITNIKVRKHKHKHFSPPMKSYKNDYNYLRFKKRRNHSNDESESSDKNISRSRKHNKYNNLSNKKNNRYNSYDSSSSYYNNKSNKYDKNGGKTNRHKRKRSRNPYEYINHKNSRNAESINSSRSYHGYNKRGRNKDNSNDTLSKRSGTYKQKRKQKK
uniref:Probable splicing factor, arginine/serine-rich 3 n=1 Tax=Piliocolobus tephrosceles TaxID=591936 RepID=A0A8C9HRR6_9PRIM